jgi:hypothetical protein
MPTPVISRVRALAASASLGLAAATFVLSSPAAAADDAVARAAKQFVAGQKAFGAGDYRSAAGLFEGAYRDKPHHSALWNAARSWQRAGDEVRAANLYARFLLEAPADAPDRDQANVAVRDLATRLGRIELHVATGTSNLRLDGKPVEAPVVYVAAGEHLAEVDSPRGDVRKVVHAPSGQIVSVTLEPAPEPSPAPSPSAAIAPRDVAQGAEGGAPRLPPFVFFTGAALSLAGGGLAVASGLDTVDKRDAFLVDPTEARLDAGNASQTRTNLAIGVTVGVAVITGAVGLFFTDWGGKAGVKKAGLGPRRAGWTW